MTAFRTRLKPPRGHTVDEDEWVERDTDELGDGLETWRILFTYIDAGDNVSGREALALAALDVAEPLTPATRRRWLDALLVARLLRAAPLNDDDTLEWEPFLCDVTVALDHFIKVHLRVDGHTEIGEAVLACVATVPRLLLRLRDYDNDAAKPAAECARKIIFDTYVEYLKTEFPNTAPIVDVKAMAEKFPQIPRSVWRLPRDMP